nr:hypothetical protein [Desulfobacteraceae bacterium]
DRWADGVLPPWLRLVAWGAVGGSISMLLYRHFSDQAAIEAGRRRIETARKFLNGFEGEMEEAWPVMRSLLRASFRQVVRVGWPAMAASLPLLFLLSWLSTSYGYTYPPAGQAPAVWAEPPQFHALWIEPPAHARKAPRILVSDGKGRTVAEVALHAPVPVIQKKRWWNLLMGNPAGYLDGRAAVDHVSASLPRREMLPFGPAWMRTWEIVFFVPLLFVSVALKAALKIK